MLSRSKRFSPTEFRCMNVLRRPASRAHLTPSSTMGQWNPANLSKSLTASHGEGKSCRSPLWRSPRMRTTMLFGSIMSQAKGVVRPSCIGRRGTNQASATSLRATSERMECMSTSLSWKQVAWTSRSTRLVRPMRMPRCAKRRQWMGVLRGTQTARRSAKPSSSRKRRRTCPEWWSELSSKVYAASISFAPPTAIRWSAM
mmetsp:Transcript_28124/g.66793  ORF Transcript_28124/g.66793 Transcript_28124/m.66793 type:complete len:200 (-) Transcript_28124:189-788(-)